MSYFVLKKGGIELLKKNNGYVFIDLMLSIFIIVLLGGTLLPIVHTLNKHIQSEQKQIKLYQILYQSVQSKKIKYDTTKIKLSYLNDKVCLEDVYSYEKVCVQK